MARPSKLTPDVRAKLVEATRLGMTRKLAAAYAGVNVATFYRYMDTGRKAKRGQFREFYDEIKRAEAQGAAQALVQVHRATKEATSSATCPECRARVEVVTPGKWQAAAWLLERRHGYRKGGPAELELEDEAAADRGQQLDEAEELRRSLAQIRGATARAIAAGSWQAVFAGQRLAMATWRELAELTRKQNPGPDDLDPETFERELVAELEGWPDQFLEHAIKVYQERHDLRLLPALVEAGGR